MGWSGKIFYRHYFKNMNQKSFLCIILVFAIVIVMGSVGYFALMRNSEPIPQQSEPWPAQDQTKTPPLAPIRKDETSNWKTYENTKYSFLIKYPDHFVVDANEGSSNFEKRYLSLNIGTADDMQKLKSTEGAEPVFYFRVDAHEPKDTSGQEGCGEEYAPTGTIVIDGIAVTKCEGMDFGSFPSLSMNFTENGVMYYAMRSNMYSGSDKKLIDQIIATFQTL